MPARKANRISFPAIAERRPFPYREAAAATVLVAVAFLAYAPALGAGFIWDDGRAITDNAAFHSPHPLADIWTGRGDADYFPLKTTILWLLYLVFGAHTSPYHVFNVGVHAANAVLLGLVLRRLAIPGAWLAGLVFLVHPTHVESVAWVSECKNTLSTLFGLLSLLCWFAYQRYIRTRLYLVSLVLFVAGLLCKSHLVILPPVLVLCAWWRQAQAAKSQPKAGAASLSSPRFLARVAVFFLVAMVFGAIALRFQHDRAIAEYQLPVGGLASRVANAGKATWWYLGKAVSPVNLWYEMPERPIEIEPEASAVLAGTRSANPAPAWPRGRLTLWPLAAIYPRWRVTTPVWYDYLPALAMVGLFTLAARHRKGRGRGLFFAFAYFLLALLPVLGLVKMSYMRASWVADHFQYLADIGVIALGCAAGARLWQRVCANRRPLLAGAAAVFVGGFAVCTLLRAADFRSEYTLWTDTVAKNPDAWQAQVRLGAALLARNEIAQAGVHFAQGVRLKPDNAEAHNNWGLALVVSGRVEEGIAEYRESLRLNPAQFHAYANLADALAKEKRYAEAADAYRTAIRASPRLAPLHFRLGEALLESGKLDEALASLRQADALAPRDPEVAAALARVQHLRAQGR
jgi:protein O-mannosyl-transferase